MDPHARMSGGSRLCRARRGGIRFAAVVAIAGLTLGACRAPGEPADAWPAAPPEDGSVLERTNITPGQPEHRASTAPPRDPTPRLRPPEPPGVSGVPEGERAPDGEEVAEVAAGMRELFPHVRVDLAARIIEFDGIVPIDVRDEQAPRVYLEVTVCTPDTKEHEALVMTRARPSHVHAALLAMDVKPGNPGGFKWDESEMMIIEPAGDPLSITFIYRDETGAEREIPATKWIINAETGEPFAPGAGRARGGERGDAEGGNAGGQESRRGFVFAGSVVRERQGREMYDADGIGTLVGLTTFGAETIAWREVISPDSQVHTPEWIADPKATPPFGTEVTVRIRPGAKESE